MYVRRFVCNYVCMYICMYVCILYDDDLNGCTDVMTIH